MTRDIALRGVTKSFDGKKVLRGVDAVLAGGKVNCLVGPSGSGKTTLARILLGLETPDGGTVEGLEGLRLSAVFQEDRLCANLSAASNIRFVSGAGEEETAAALAAVGLEGEGGQKAGELSGGQKRRVALVRALLAPFDLLVLDEPFDGLDGRTKERAIAWTRSHLAGRTAVLITHDEGEARALCDGAVVRLEG